MIVGAVLRAQVSDEEQRKREQFLKTRTVASDADESPSPTPKRKAKKSTTRKGTPTPKPKAKAKAKSKKTPEPETPAPATKENAQRSTSNVQRPTEEEGSTPAKAKSKKKSAAKKSPTPTGKRKRKKASPAPEKTPTPTKTPAPKRIEATRASPTPVERPTAPLPRAIAVPSPEERAQVVIEKSGFEGDQGLAPTPSPPPRRFLFWPLANRPTSGTSYHYLTRSVIEEIRRAPVQRRRWQFIVVHNSGTRQGNARVFDYYHRHVRRMQNGLAYHFVIGNGTSTGNGQIEVGDRWRRQINGGHVHSDYLNNISLGICLVGDFNHDQPTRAQLECCEELIRYLRERCGKIDNHDILVRPHREMNPPRWATDCPGDVFPYSWFRRFR